MHNIDRLDWVTEQVRAERCELDADSDGGIVEVMAVFVSPQMRSIMIVPLWQRLETLRLQLREVSGWKAIGTVHAVSKGMFGNGKPLELTMGFRRFSLLDGNEIDPDDEDTLRNEALRVLQSYTEWKWDETFTPVTGGSTPSTSVAVAYVN